MSKPDQKQYIRPRASSSTPRIDVGIAYRLLVHAYARAHSTQQGVEQPTQREEGA